MSQERPSRGCDANGNIQGGLAMTVVGGVMVGVWAGLEALTPEAYGRTFFYVNGGVWALAAVGGLACAGVGIARKIAECARHTRFFSPTVSAEAGEKGALMPAEHLILQNPTSPR
ncbi:MAG TPA: hypothetical protein VGV92_08410 [Gammaproteobacteria bacterium]|nr:hypothetical protein [Gammaproteobacteria bacterium]